MIDKKITDEQIVQVLECCEQNKKDCTKCPHFADCFKNDMYFLPEVLERFKNLKAKNKELDEKNVIKRGLIDRLKADNERLQEENHIYNEANHIIAYQRNQRDKEITALQRQIKGLHIYENRIKTEAYKEFVDELLERAKSTRNYFEIKSLVTSVINEMVGEIRFIQENIDAMSVEEFDEVLCDCGIETIKPSVESEYVEVVSRVNDVAHDYESKEEWCPLKEKVGEG